MTIKPLSGLDSLHRRQLLTGGLAAAGASLLPGRALADCITGNNGMLGPAGTWRVFQNVPPPLDDTHYNTIAYPFFPVTDSYSWQQNVNSILNRSTWSGGNTWMYVWANRTNKVVVQNLGNQNADLKPNLIQNPTPVYLTRECRVVYTSLAKANAATQSMIRYWLGMSNYDEPWIDAGGSTKDFVFYSDMLQNPDKYFTQTVLSQDVYYQVMTDVPWLPSTIFGGAGSFNRSTMLNGRSAQVPGIVLDFEPGDYRTSQSTTLFFNAIASDIKQAGAKLFLWTNPLNRIGNTHGLNSVNLPHIVNDLCDYTSVQLWAANPENAAQSYENQIATIKGYGCNGAVPYNKLALVLDLKAGLADAQFVHNLLNGPAASNPQAIGFWRNGMREGGACGTQENNLIITAMEGSTALGIAPVAPTALPAGWQPTCPFP